MRSRGRLVDQEDRCTMGSTPALSETEYLATIAMDGSPAIQFIPTTHIAVLHLVGGKADIVSRHGAKQAIGRGQALKSKHHVRTA